MAERVAIVGGGYAGLAAGVELARQAMPVTVFEAGRRLGGRARRIPHRDAWLDNGQHILLGAYRETLRLMALVGVGERHLARLPLTLLVPGRFRLKAAPVPAPLHLLGGLLTARGLNLGERMGAIRFMLAMRRLGFRLPRDTSVATLLARYRQDGEPARSLWEPLCVAALNTPVAEASAQVFLNVLRDGLNRARSDSDLLLPGADLSALFPDAAAAFIEQHGGRIEPGCTVSAIEALEVGFSLQAGGKVQRFSQVVCAVGPHQLAGLVHSMPPLAEPLRMVQSFRYQSIHTVYLQYPDPVALPFPMLGLHSGPAQWLFDRGYLCGQAGLVAAVISASGALEKLSQDRVAEQVSRQLESHFPAWPRPRWHKVISEKRATFACVPGMERPGQATPVPGLYLAGDYTAGDYPATLEAAVASGVRCAELILGQSRARSP